MAKRIPFLAALICLLSLLASAQSTSQISGTVTAPDGSAIPGATVVATNLSTNIARRTQTTAGGTYLLPELALGSYKLEVQKPGFKAFTQSGIVLQVNSNPTVNVALQIGSVSQTVEVRANASMVSQQATGVGQVIQPEQVIDLPLNGRQATDLIALSGAAVPGTTGGLTGSLDFPTAVSYSVAGSQQNATEYTLDGAPNMDYRTNIGEPLPFPDALQEFRVASSAQPANTSNRPGGSVTGATRSGTNQFHGDLFEFIRNGVMDAEAYTFPNSAGVAPPGVRDNLKRNQFGGTIGGPLLHNKLFFFYGFQGTLERQQTPNSNAVVPTAAMLAGDFTTYLSPACQHGKQLYLNDTVRDPNGGPAQPLVTAHHSNILLPQWLTTKAAQINGAIAALYPTPTDGCGDTSASHYQADNEYQNVVRVDWQRTANDAIFARYFIDDYSLPSYLAPGKLNLLSSSGAGLSDRYQSIVVGDTRTFGGTAVNAFRVNFGRSASDRVSNPRIPTLCSLGALATCQVSNFVTGLFISPGFLGFDNENVYGATETLGWQHGSHYFQIGGTWQHVLMKSDGVFQVNPWPRYVNGNASYTGNNVADFVTGNVDSLLQGNGQLGNDGQNYPTVFVNDNWKISSTVNLNYGLKWQPFFPQHSGYNFASDFSMAAYNAGQVSKVFTNAPPGLTFPGDAGFNGTSDTNNVLGDFAPTIGVSWDPSGKGTEVIRAGYGIAYDTSVLWNTMHVVLNPPWGSTLNFTPAPVAAYSNVATDGGGIANPFFGIPGGNPFPTPTPSASFAFPPTGTYVFEAQDNKPAKSQQWNFSIQRQFGANWLLSASYIGSRTSRIWAGVNLDPAQVITAGMTAPGIASTAGMTGTSGPCTLMYLGQQVTFPTCNGNATESVNNVSNENARRVLTLANPNQGPKFNGGLVQAQDIGIATYNGMLLSLQHRLSNGLSVLTNYTWSHCLDNAESGQDIGNAFQNPANPMGDYGACNSDQRQAFNLSLIAQSPKFGSGLAQTLIGDWTISGIFTAHTGLPFNVTNGSDVSLTGIGQDRPNQVGDPFQAGPIAANPGCTAPTQVNTLLHWFNPCAFATQTAGTFGNTARNALYGPGNWNLNAALWRTFAIGEARTVQFRAEAFNVLNHPQFGNPAPSLSSGAVGSISTAAPGSNNRIVQLALKLTF